MTQRSLLVSTAVYTALACVSVTFAQAPVVNIDPHRHGNMAAAQRFIVQAYQKLNEAQRDNQDQLGGHAQKAISSLRPTLRSDWLPMSPIRKADNRSALSSKDSAGQWRRKINSLAMATNLQ